MPKTQRQILMIDSSLRDGNHAVKHQINELQISAYAQAADRAGIPIVIVGHGNGLGASSLQVGESLLSDKKMLSTAKRHIKHSKLGVYVMPGFATINKDLKQALELGVDVFCIGCHCTEADTTQKHIDYVCKKGKVAYGNLMMTHMISKEDLLQECKKMANYGARGVILMDSAGAFLPRDTTEKISFLVSGMNIPIGFHAHNNLEMAVANSIAAVEAGASILDSSIRGFAAGAGNAAIEVLVAVLHKMGYSTGIDLNKILDASKLARNQLMPKDLATTPENIVSGLAGVFSGFVGHVNRISKQFQVDPLEVFFELGRRKVVGGQEDLIVESAMHLSKKTRNKIKKLSS